MSNGQLDLRSQVTELLLKANGIGSAAIEVECQGGCVTLKGTVASEQDRATALSLVQGQAGVDQVINRLEVSG